ncbi:MAG TPA: tetratricopeptide repeat protein [Pyrinomonadaceae bacterium]|jgi:Flp pilus assembly protein TadD
MSENRFGKLEAEGLAFLHAGQFADAIEVFMKLAEENPGYEHGICFYHLACCFEDVGDFEKARLHYERALQAAPGDVYRVGGYAAFLYLHGNPKDAFEAQLNYLRVVRRMGNKTDEEKAISNLKHLGAKLGLTEDEIMRTGQ